MRANTGDKFTITSEVGEWYELTIPSGESAFVAKWVVSVSVEDLNDVNTNSILPKRERGTLNGLTIVIDPGHGGNDYGTIGANGTNEKEITLSTSLLLAEKLRAAGAIVYLSRDSDNYITLQDRVSISHKRNADAFISVHYDATIDPSIKGFTTYYTQEKQKALATAVNNGLASTISLRNRGAQKANYLVLRENRQLAILLELGYLSNPSEEKAVTTNSFRQQATDGIYKGLIEYFDANID